MLALRAVERPLGKRETMTMAYCKIAAVGLVGLALLAIVRGTTAIPTQSKPESTRFLVGIGEATTDLSSLGISRHTCILVLPDGRFHLESRIQHLPSSVATANNFDYSLDSLQLQRLREILGDERIRQLPEYASPAMPMAVTWSSGFNARIPRATGVQNVGYWKWRGGTPAASPNSAPESVKKGWQESETALQPLVDWLHGIEALRLPKSDAKATMCDADADSNAQ
jgi:hypothetical protein